MIKRYFKENKGVTGVDLVVATVVIIIFSGILTSLMASLYKTSAEIQASSIAMAYATIISEKIDEKSFEEVSNNENFVAYLKAKGEVEIPDNYNITVIKASENGLNSEYIKSISIVVSYKVMNNDKSLSLSKLKIKEVEK